MQYNGRDLRERLFPGLHLTVKQSEKLSNSAKATHQTLGAPAAGGHAIPARKQTFRPAGKTLNPEGSSEMEEFIGPGMVMWR